MARYVRQLFGEYAASRCNRQFMETLSTGAALKTTANKAAEDADRIHRFMEF